MSKWLASGTRLGNSGAMQELVLHSECQPGPIRRVSAAIASRPGGCRTSFRLEGAIGQIKVPEPAAAERMDNLWQTTCFEIFWQPLGGSYYREFNLSPSSRWACYDFDGFRLNSRDAPVEAIAIASLADASTLVLEADIVSVLPLPARVALNAIVEDREGNIQFWALAFQPGKAEFHSETCRQLALASD